jgi:hypothetical protein
MRIRIRDRGYPGSGMENTDSGSGINIPDPKQNTAYDRTGTHFTASLSSKSY